MKKILALLLALCMLMALAACGAQETKTEETKTEETPVEETKTEETKTEETKTEEVAAAPLSDETHAAWVAHGQYLLADGTQNSWNGKDTEVYEASALTAISLDDVKAIDEDLYNALAAKEVKYLYTVDLIFGTNDAGWTTDCLIDGVLYHANGSYAFKIAQCTVDVDGDNKVYAEDQWISDPKTAHAESLTPATIFMPVWQEEADENGFSWASNPVVIGGAGLYTLVIAQYKNASSPEQAGFGIGLVLKEAKEGIPYEEVVEFIPADHTYGIIGGFNDWNGDVAMDATAENVWTGEVELTAGTEFKVRADADWTYSWGTEDGGNCVAEADGTYVVTIDFSSGNGVVTAALKGGEEEAAGETAEDNAWLIGTWEGKLDLVSVLAASEPDTAAMFGEDPIELVMLLTFKEDGTVEGAFDMEASLPAIEAALKNVLTSMIEAQGMTIEEFEKASGSTMDEMLADAMAQMNPEDLANAEDMNGNYTVDGEKVLINDNEENALVRVDDTLVLSADGVEVVFTKR